MYLGYYELRNPCLEICLKSPFLEDRVTRNMVNRRKHCYNLNDSTVFIFSGHFEGK